MANPQPERSSFAIVTNGDEVLFVKLRSGDRATYAVSRVFSPFASSRELYGVLQVLKQMGAIVRDDE
jgi:hypothetical protein